MIISSQQTLFDCRPHAYTHAYIHPYSYISLYRHLCTYVLPNGSVWVCIYVHTYISLFPFFCTCVSDLLQLESRQAGMNVCIYINCIHVRTFVFVCMVVHVCMCTFVMLALAYAQVVLARILLCRGSKNIE